MPNSIIIRNMDDAERAAKAMSASGFFADSKGAAQAVVKILAGAELGFGPFASMTGVHIIQNRPTLAANLIAAAVKRSGKYNYRVIEHTDKVCSIDFYEEGNKIGNSAYTWKEAQDAGLTAKDNWKKYPRNMLFARAISNGQKWYAPDAFNGATVYTPDELGAIEDAEGNMVHAPEVVEDPGQKMITDDLWDRWLALCNRAEKVDISYPLFDRHDVNFSELTAAGVELRGIVENAEIQAQAETGAQ